MFNYLFPIFCFGVIISGIVFLGIIEASRQAKAESTSKVDGQPLDGKLIPVRADRSRAPTFTARGDNHINHE